MGMSLSMGLGLSAIRRTGGGGFDYYVDPEFGSALNSGRSPGAAFASFEDVPLAAGLRIGYVRGETALSKIDRYPISISAAGVYIGTHGEGFKPNLWGSIRHTSGWSLVSGTTFQKSIGYTAVNTFRVAPDGTVTKLLLGTFGSLTSGQFGVSGGTLQINIGEDPDGVIIEVPRAATGTLVDLAVGGDNFTMRGLRTWFAPDNGFLITSVSDVSGIDLDISYCGGDGWGVHGDGAPSFRATLSSSAVRRNGRVRTTSGSNGDGVSYHGKSTGTVTGCLITDNEKGGVTNLMRTHVDVIGSRLRNNNLEFVLLNDGSADPGVQRLLYSIIEWTTTNDGSSGRAAVALGSADAANPATVKLFNNVLRRVSGSATTGGVRLNEGLVEAKNNIITGFARGIDFRSTDFGTLDNDYNCMFGNTTNYFNNGTNDGTGPGGVLAGAHDITTDPLFTDAANGDYSLQSGSPCLNTGVNVGLTSDYAGNPVPFGSAPDIGAFERQSA